MDALRNINLSFILVFVEGLLSFFSPCVIPLIPVYMSYLAGNAKKSDDHGNLTYQTKKVFFHTLLFVLGISFAFFILGMTFTALGLFFQSHQMLFTRIGGIVIIIFGLHQIGFLSFNLLQKERKLPFRLGESSINPVLAFLMGFTFSFAWTPCIGPALSSVLIMASGAGNSLEGNLLVLLYTLGFTLPFLLLGLFTTQALNFLKKHQRLLKYTVKAGGFILILIGFMVFSGWMNGFSKYLNSVSPESFPKISNNSNNFIPTPLPTRVPEENPTPSIAPDVSQDTDSVKEDEKVVLAPDFTLTDQYGNPHTLSDYKGKVVFLNFWATWCTPCQKEMPDIEALYQEYNQNQDDIIILGVANPQSTSYPFNQDVSEDKIISYLEDHDYTFPVLFDETGDILSQYYISSFPTTFLIDKNGNIVGYAPGMLQKDIMYRVIQQAQDAAE